MPSRGEMAGQDFAPVSFGTKKPTQTPSQKVAANGQKFPGSSMTSSGMTAAKLDAETDELKHQTVSKDLRIALQKARQAKGLSQKQLAQQARAAPLSRQRHLHARPNQLHMHRSPCPRRSAAAQHGAASDQRVRVGQSDPQQWRHRQD